MFMGVSALVKAASIPSVTAVEAAPFRKLKMRHRQVVALHLSGHSNSEIEQLLGRSGGYASQVLNNPTVKLLLERMYSDYDMQLRALVPTAITTLGRNMKCGDPATEVRAAREVLLANGKYDEQGERRVTAEDVVERVLEVVDPDGTRYRMAERRLSRTASLGIPQIAEDDCGTQGEEYATEGEVMNGD